jgi:superfamily II DNA or RNA helicase
MKQKLDESKLERQEQFISTWTNNFGKGTLEAVTAFGKTYTTMLIIKKMLVKNPNRNFVIIVPSIQLKSQWEAKVEDLKVPRSKVQVHVINGLTINKVKLSCTMLILDEVHLYLNGEVFSKVFELIDYKFILGLSATIDRNALGYNLLREKCPVIDTITQEEANNKGWVAEYKEFVLSIELNEKEREYLEEINTKFSTYFRKFNFEFHLAMGCMSNRGMALDYAYRMGWRDGLGQSHPWSPQRIAFYSVQFSRAMRERKTFLYELETKKSIIKEISEKLKYRTIVFSESTKFADDVTTMVGDEAVSYHSNLPTEIRKVKNKKGQIVEKKFGKTKLQKEALTKFQDGRYKVRLLSTAKALNQGADLPSAQIAVMASYNSSFLTTVQRRGRVIRNYTNSKGETKKALVIYLAVKDSQEEKWLKKATNMSNLDWTDSIDYIVENAFTEDIFVQED